MGLPEFKGAILQESKIRDYLLCESHPVGRFKAAFFSSLGYSGREWEVLERDLRIHAAENDAVPSDHITYGQKYEIRGRIQGPSGNSAALVAVWILLDGEDFPRFVTAFPGARS